MTWRKRASPAPAFRQPAPYNPRTGSHALLGAEGITSRVAMMQVIGDDDTQENADKHEKYVICRGYDPETRKFYHRINVAKPYGVRGTYPYRLAQVFPAIKPRTRLRDTSGMAETSVGHPEDLDEEIVILTDDDGNPIWWLLLDSQPSPLIQVKWDSENGIPQFGVFEHWPNGLASPTDPATQNPIIWGHEVRTYPGLRKAYIASSALEQNGIAECWRAQWQPRWAYWAKELLAAKTALGSIPCGPAPAELADFPTKHRFQMCPWLPGGFKVLAGSMDDVLKQFDEDNDRWAMLVMAIDPDAYHLWCKAEEPWQACTSHYNVILARPCSDAAGTYTYNGTDTAPGGTDPLPDLTIVVAIPVLPHKDPNIATGQVFRYKPHFANQATGLVAISGVSARFITEPSIYDDKIGTVKAWVGTPGSPPQGWEVIANAEARRLAGYKDGDPNYGTMRTVVDLAYEAGASIDESYTVQWIERVMNT